MFMSSKFFLNLIVFFIETESFCRFFFSNISFLCFLSVITKFENKILIFFLKAFLKKANGFFNSFSMRQRLIDILVANGTGIQIYKGPLLIN